MKHFLCALLIVLACALSAGMGYYLSWHRLRSEAIPAFATWPGTPFSRNEAVAIAIREWRLFGQPVHDEMPNPAAPPSMPKAERLPGLWERIGEYCWIGLPRGSITRGTTGKHNAYGSVFPPQRDEDHAWSGAFISYIMRLSGARDGFPYSQTHSDYINAAWKATAGGNSAFLLRTERLEKYAPQPGDLVCYARPKGTDKPMRYDNLPLDHFASHCDIVVDTAPGVISVIGGNVSDAVSMKHVPVSKEGLLAGADGEPLDKRYPWFVVLRVVYAQ